MKFGIIFWGKSTDSISVTEQNWKLWQGKYLEFHVNLYRVWKILTVPSHYTIFLMTSMVNDMEHRTFNFSVHSINTRNKLQLLRPVAILTSFQKACILQA